jgi:hypoxanthine phosphoribosyltransferase
MLRHSLPVLVSAAEIQRRVGELAAQIDADFAEGILYLVAVLKGACFFVADLARAIERPVRLDFIGISSYGASSTSSGRIRITKDLDASIEGADVLLVEDIVDTGRTLEYLVGHLERLRPRRLRVAALLDKRGRRVRPVTIHYAGFEVPNRFVVGYGLDFAEDYRALPDICVLEKPETSPDES